MDKPQIIGLGLNGLIGSRIEALLKEDFDFVSLSLEQGIDITKEETLAKIKEYKDAAKERNSKIGVSCIYGCILQSLYEFVVGMNDFMIMVYEDRELVEDMLEVSTEHYVKLTKKLVEGGIDFIFPADDVAFKTGLFIPPKIFKEIWECYTKFY